LRLAIACLPGLILGLALCGCDRQKAAAPQGGAPVAANAAAPAEEGNDSADATPTGRLDRSHQGTMAPAAGFEDAQGHPTSLAAFRGKPVLVNFWATWCGPCVSEMPTLDGLAARESGGNLQVVAISQDSDPTARRKVDDFFGAHHFQRLQPFLDSQMHLMAALQLDTLPTTILYDAQGREVWRMVGMSDWQDQRAARLITETIPG
jgi:thiol-disulfide isomerase/thioredoxin